jgi:hypothetical protein
MRTSYKLSAGNSNISSILEPCMAVHSSTTPIALVSSSTTLTPLDFVHSDA